MAYTPINWQTGDTITAEKLNRCDNGWSVGMTQLFNETVTTADYGEGPFALLTYTGAETPESLVIVWDSTQYSCTYTGDSDGGFYGDPEGSYTDYPFALVYEPHGSQWRVYTQTAGTHTIAASTAVIDIGADFSKATLMAGSFEVVSGVTTFQDAHDAMVAGKYVYVTSVDGSFAYHSPVTALNTALYRIYAVQTYQGGSPTKLTLSASSADGVLTVLS